MINYKSFTLSNGLKVFVLPDKTSSLAAINILYKVGSRDESPNKTGFAHLFEHLMFGGSVNIQNYDEPLQAVGGQNNAFTTTDYTNYYLTVPSDNLETGFWLESDRMLSLSFDPKVLEVQRKVVLEEFKQRYLNQPYGDVWHHLRKLVYKNHPYQWPVIGKELSHIENATMDQVEGFFNKFYHPGNAYMTVAGNVDYDQVYELSEKWFGDINPVQMTERKYSKEEKQAERREVFIEKDVPQNALYIAFPMPGKFDEDFIPVDLLSDILGRGKSSRIFQKLVLEKKIFTNASAYVLGSIDPGMLVINGRISEGVSYDKAEKAIREVISDLLDKGISERELEKVKNKAISTLEFGHIDVLDRATSLSYCAAFTRPDFLNEESKLINDCSIDNLEKNAVEILSVSNSSVLKYGK